MPKPRLSLDEKHRRNTLVLFLRDSEELSFTAIGQRFGITKAAAQRIYEKVKSCSKPCSSSSSKQP